MRVPNKSAQPAGPLPGTGYQALRHETLLDAPKREEASFAPFTAPLKNTAAILDGIDSLADAGRKIAARLQEERDDAAARDALVTLNKAYDAYAHGDEGTDGDGTGGGGTGGASPGETLSQGEYGRKGREAFDAVSRGREWFEKETARLAKDLSDNAARKFREHSAQLRVSALPGLARHEAAERRAYALQSLEAHRDIEHRNAVANFTDPVRYNQFVAQKAGIELQRAMKLGLPQDEALLAVKKSVSETLAGVFENQVKAGEFSLAQTLYNDARISGDKKVMLADAYRRARLRHELDSARADPESARSRLGELRKETRGRGSASPLDFTEEDFAALENQIAASEKRREAEKIQRVDRITGGFESAFALAVKTGDFSRVLEAEEALLTLGREDIAEKSKQMREMHTAIRPLLEAAKGMPFHDREAAEETAFARLAGTWGEEAAAPLRAICSGELEREKTRALKDPAAYAAGTLQAEGNAGTGGAREDLPTANLSREAAAIENMAAQAALFKGVEGFTPKVLTAAEAAKAKSVLAEEKTPNAAKLLSLVRLHESYGSLGETALDELELAPAVRAAVDLAIQDPRQEAFAAGLLGAASLPGKQKDEAANRLALLAGTNPKAKAILLRFAGQDAPAPQDGPLPGTAQSPDADSGKDRAAADGEAAPPAPLAAEKAASAVIPHGRFQGERDTITTAWDLMRRALDGEAVSMEAFKQSGWITPGQAELGAKLQAALAGEKGVAFREAARKMLAGIGSPSSDALRACAVERLLANLDSGMDADAAIRTSVTQAKEILGYSVVDLLLDGAQGSVTGLAVRNRMPDRLTEKQRANLSLPESLFLGLGQTAGDSPTLAMGGASGSLAGPGGAIAGALGLTEGMRAYYMDAIRNPEIRSIDDVLRRAKATGWGGLEGVVSGLGAAGGGKLGTAVAKKAGMEIAGTMTASATGETLGMTTASAAMRGEFPSWEEFLNNAAFIVGLRGMGRAGKGTKEAMARTLENLWRDTGVSPKAVSQAAKADPAVVQYLDNQKLPVPETLANEIQRAVIYNDTRSVKMTFTETGVQPSITDRPELRKYLNSLNGEEMAAMKAKDPAAYLATLKSIVRKIFPKGGELQFRTENGKLDYEHLLTDEARSMFVHTLPKTLKDHDIKVEFTTREGMEKAYLIKKYFEPNIQKDLWDVLVFHEAELRTKIARSGSKGQNYVESIITKAE